jgi:hypothetical protein
MSKYKQSIPYSRQMLQDVINERSKRMVNGLTGSWPKSPPASWPRRLQVRIEMWRERIALRIAPWLEGE